MYRLIERICEEHGNGLQLINQPTGSGKTYSTNRFIHEHFTKGDPRGTRNVVVVTTNKNNLAFRELRRMFEESGDLEVFDRIFLYLDSISNMVLDGYEPSMEEDIHRAMGHNPTVGGFLTSIRNIKRSTDASGKESPAVKEAVQRFAKDVEPPFRRMLRGILRKKGNKYEARLRFIESNPEWLWVTKLYPTVYTRSRKLFFMSADKFVSRNDTIIDVSNVVYESMIAKKAIIFIDEFDSTKNQILSRLAEDSVKNRVDYLDMFQKVYQGGMDVNIDPDIYKPHEDLQIDLNEVHASKMKRLREVRRKYHLESPVVLDGSVIGCRPFLFKSDISFIVSSADVGLTVRYDRKSKKSIISAEKGGKSSKELRRMFDEIDRAIDGYCSLIRVLAYNYHKKNDPTLSYEDCVYIILDLYGISLGVPSYRVHLHKRVMLGTKSPKKFPGVDTSIYERGYEYFAFLDDPISKERANIQLISCLVSAEKVLLKVCERALVFGVSATSEFKTVLGNYDLDYLMSRLGDEYLPSVSEDETLLEQVRNAYGNYDNRGITWDVTSVGVGTDGIWNDDLWGNVFTDEKHLCVVRDRLSGVSDFHLKRYYRLAYALKSFICSERKRNGLFFCNMHPVERDPVFNKDLIKQMFDIMLAEARKDNPYLPEIRISFLKRDDFDSHKRDIQKDMASGVRAAIITSYGTFSTGQNMQFDIPDGVDARNVSLMEDRGQMDVDFVYLQTPTHLMHAPEGEEYEKERLLHMCDAHYLKSNGEITQKECIRAVNAALSSSPVEIKMTVGLANDTVSGHMFASAICTQAIGRICRTNMKNQEISVYYDEEIRKYVDQSLESYGLVSPETEHFYRHCTDGRQTRTDNSRLEELAVFRSHNADTIIHEMLGWHDDEEIENYKAIRHDLLCSPSMDELNNTAYQMYVELPERSDHYWCSYTGEYRDLAISFDRPLPKGTRVDTSGLRFDELLSIPGLRDHFETMGYATELKAGRYLVSPVAAKNLLMGMHGEVAGCYIIDPEGKILKDMPRESFEKFDFQINEDVAVDFKHWASDMFTLSSVQHRKIIQKMEESGHSTVYVVNILLPEGKSRDNMVYEEKGKRIVKVPWLFDPGSGQFNDRMISEIREAAHGNE